MEYALQEWTLQFDVQNELMRKDPEGSLNSVDYLGMRIRIQQVTQLFVGLWKGFVVFIYNLETN